MRANQSATCFANGGDQRERERERVLLPVGKIKPAHLVRGQEGDSVRTVVVAHLFPRLCLFLSPHSHRLSVPLCCQVGASWVMILMIDRLVSQRSLEKERRANIMQEHPAQLWSGEVTDDAVMEAAAGGGVFYTPHQVLRSC